MEYYINVAQLILLVSLSALVIYATTVLARTKNILENVEKDLKEVTARILPVLSNFEIISSRLRTILESVDDQVTIVKSSVEKIKSIADAVADFQAKVQEQIESPILEIASTVGAIVSGVTTFIKRFRGKKEEISY
ncbi:MAG: hypothetical protein O3A55_07410 [Bacteroidetes bacterium]|nr:hypothetical protein [Bacteroidota bacterium]